MTNALLVRDSEWDNFPMHVLVIWRMMSRRKCLGGGVGLFMNAWSLCVFYNMDYTSESSLIKRGMRFRGENFKLSGEVRVAITFYQHQHAFLVGHSSQDVAVSTLLPGLSTLDQCYRAKTFRTRHELERELKNARTKLLAEIRLDLQGEMKKFHKR